MIGGVLRDDDDADDDAIAYARNDNDDAIADARYCRALWGGGGVGGVHSPRGGGVGGGP